MRLFKGLTTTVLTAAVLLGGIHLVGRTDRPPGAGAQAGETSARPAAPPAAGETAVTLLTGDKVALFQAGKGMTIEPGPGRAGIRFQRESHDGHTYVVPSDARDLVARGKLDRRLFDVASLAKLGYDDTAAGGVPLIVSYGKGRKPSAAGLVGAGAQSVKGLSSIDSIALSVGKAEAGKAWKLLRTEAASASVDKVWLDGKRRVQLDESVPQIGAPEVWDAGYTGDGSKVAVLDTGIDARHPDLADALTEMQDFTGSANGVRDMYGHGTHVASIIAGSGKASDGRYKGVAPDCELLVGKVIGDDGYGTESDIIAGMEWAARTEHADVVNLSLGGYDSHDLDPLEKAVDDLTEETGALFVIAAGNAGPDPKSISSPANAAAALAVGAVTKQDQIAEFSSRGPTDWNWQLKPDITAPGVDIVAAKADGTELGDPVGEHYTSLSGTSMATPHVAGAAAILAQRHPGWKAAELKAALMASARPNPALGVFDQGTGRVDLPAAITQSVVSDPVSLSFGVQQWPHDDDEPVRRTLTYRNLGTEPVELQLDAELTGPGGEPAPDGAIELTPDVLSVPAGEAATVTVTSDTSRGGPDGMYSGKITATAGRQRVLTPIGVEQEVESYNLTLKDIGPDGTLVPASGFVSNLRGWRYGEADLFDETGPATVRVPAGTYFLHTNVDTDNASYLMTQPTFTLDRDKTITADARTAKRVTTAVENPDAKPALVDVGYYRERGGEDDLGFQGALLAHSFDGVFTAQLGPPGPTKGLTGYVASQWARPGPQDEFDNSPYTYALFDTTPGSFFTGYHRDVSNAGLAAVKTSRNAQRPGQKADLIQFPPPFIISTSTRFRYDLPSAATHYVEGGNVDWRRILLLTAESGSLVGILEPSRRSFLAGRAYKERWNAAAFAPTWAGPDAYAERIGNHLSVSVPAYSDADGHGGFSRTDQAETILLRNGTQAASSDEIGLLEAEVEPGNASYELRTAADRSSLSDFSNHTQVTWRFQSKQPTGDTEALPLWVARFAPKVDAHNLNHAAGNVTNVPVTFEIPRGAVVGRISRATIEASTDDGATWTKTKLTAVGKRAYIATIRTPAGARFVSLRAKVTDSMGNELEQTVIHAYGLAG